MDLGYNSNGILHNIICTNALSVDDPLCSAAKTFATCSDPLWSAAKSFATRSLGSLNNNTFPPNYFWTFEFSQKHKCNEAILD